MLQHAVGILVAGHSALPRIESRTWVKTCIRVVFIQTKKASRLRLFGDESTAPPCGFIVDGFHPLDRERTLSVILPPAKQ